MNGEKDMTNRSNTQKNSEYQERIIIAQAFNKAIDILLSTRPQFRKRGSDEIDLHAISAFCRDVNYVTIQLAENLNSLESLAIKDLRTVLNEILNDQ